VKRVLATLRARHGLVLVKLLPIERIQRSPFLPFQRRIRELDAVLLGTIDRVRRLREEARGDSVVADLLASRDAAGDPPTDAEIRDALVTILIAGHDTTSVALAWALERIVSHPEVLSRIEAEIDGVTRGEPLREDHLASLEFLEAAIKESLRARTVLPFVVRLTKEPFAAGGREYPADILLCPSSHLTHRREELYPDPDRFRPERFLERRFGAHEWFPFGGGGRTCLGMAFALFEMKVVLATVFSMARLVRPADARSCPIRRGLALAPDDGARVTLAARRDSSAWSEN
jgi:cytochrome P450